MTIMTRFSARGLPRQTSCHGKGLTSETSRGAKTFDPELKRTKTATVAANKADRVMPEPPPPHKKKEPVPKDRRSVGKSLALRLDGRMT
ncbi:MAG TPA: hypothetical protein GX507_08150 [Clostridia bacterium]|nr:hypothetical protein [Clostridia bacterium]